MVETALSLVSRLIASMPLSSIARFAPIAPQIEMHTMLVCSVHRPDIFNGALLFNQPSHVRSTTAGPGMTDSRFTGFSLNTSLEFGPPTMFRLPNAGPPTLGRNDTLVDDRPIKCASDPIVQAEVAKLTVATSTSLGVLTCFTTGWWGALSDRYGRTRILGISMIGILFSDFNFIATVFYFQRLPGGYWFLVLGSVVDGILGGFAAATAATQAYIADTTTQATRSQLFSIVHGLRFSGLALGPALGSLLIRATGSALSIFYATTSLHLCYALLVWFFVPESLLDEQMRQSRFRYEEERKRDFNDRRGGLVAGVKRSLTFLSPLIVFSPRPVKETEGLGPFKGKKQDWSLTWVAAAYGLSGAILGSYSYQYMYATATFRWGTEFMGYWISLMGTACAVFLTFILPAIIKLFKHSPTTTNFPAQHDSTREACTSDPNSEERPLLADSPGQESSSSNRRPVLAQGTIQKQELNSTAFDVALAQCSLVNDGVSFIIVLLVPTGVAFTVSSLMRSFGTGFDPAMQSVALSIYTRRGGTESGRLFGGLSVLQALSLQILGPAMYGLMYMRTAAMFPRAMFILMIVTTIVSFSPLELVKKPALLLAPENTEDRRTAQSDRAGTDV